MRDTITVQPADTLSTARAEYDLAKQQLRVEATSSNASAALSVFVSATQEFIGQLTTLGDGEFRGQIHWPVNPVTITVKSSLGGSATAAVAAK